MTNLATSVLIVGAGPVGLTLALDLASRGIDAIIVEQRPADEKATPRANHVSARAMETFRRLGVAEEVRDAGLPGDYPPDVAWMTTMTGYELTRIELASRDEVRAPGYADPDWPTPEPQHKINQMYLEPILRRRVAGNPNIRMLHRVRFDGYHEDAGRVIARLTELGSGRAFTIDAAYAVGCDGGNSTVRKAIGVTFSGDAALTRVVSLHIRAPDLMRRLPHKPAHRYFVVNGRQNGSVVSLNGTDLWSIHAMLPTPDSDPADLDHDKAIREITGLDDLEYETFAVDPWVGRRLLADRLRVGNVFLAGDAAHIWVPNGGYGMNAGIADAENLAWRLAAVLQGWGGPNLLDGYQRERHPITDQVSNFAKNLAIANRAPAFRAPPAELEAEGPPGDAARQRHGAALYELNLPQFKPLGLNFAYFYDDSPNIAYDDEKAPAYTLGDYTPSTAPGCRLPHFFRDDGTSLYDALGDGFALLRLDRAVAVSAIVAAATSAGVPMRVVEVDRAEAGHVYEHALILVRPDRHIAWRGDMLPADSDMLIERIRGG